MVVACNRLILRWMMKLTSFRLIVANIVGSDWHPALFGITLTPLRRWRVYIESLQQMQCEPCRSAKCSLKIWVFFRFKQHASVKKTTVPSVIIMSSSILSWAKAPWQKFQRDKHTLSHRPRSFEELLSKGKGVVLSLFHWHFPHWTNILKTVLPHVHIPPIKKAPPHQGDTIHRASGLRPSHVTFAALLSCAEKSQLWFLAQQLLQMAEETQVKLNTVAYNAVRRAHSVFECFGRNFGSWIVFKDWRLSQFVIDFLLFCIRDDMEEWIHHAIGLAKSWSITKGDGWSMNHYNHAQFLRVWFC